MSTPRTFQLVVSLGDDGRLDKPVRVIGSTEVNIETIGDVGLYTIKDKSDKIVGEVCISITYMQPQNIFHIESNADLFGDDYDASDCAMSDGLLELIRLQLASNQLSFYLVNSLWNNAGRRL